MDSSATTTNKPATTERTLTKEQIEARLDRARGGGSGLMVELCKLALEGNASARYLVAADIRQDEPPQVFEVGAEVDVVTRLEPRETEGAKLTFVGDKTPDGQRFRAESLDGRTSFEGWVTTFYYEGAIPGRGQLCGKHGAGSSETILNVMTSRSIF